MATFRLIRRLREVYRLLEAISNKMMDLEEEFAGSSYQQRLFWLEERAESHAEWLEKKLLRQLN